MFEQLVMMVMIVFDDNRISFGHNEVLAIDQAEDVRLENLFGRAGCVEAGLQKHETIHSGSDHIDVMGNQ
jgi:hypothetical protein